MLPLRSGRPGKAVAALHIACHQCRRGDPDPGPRLGRGGAAAGAARPSKQDLGNALARPGGAHLLGTDNVGRDVLSRVIWGTRISLVAGFVSVAMALLTGGVLGLVAGYSGGRVDGLVMRAMDAVLSFPPLVLALALGAMLGAGLTGVLIALGVVYTPTFAR